MLDRNSRFGRLGRRLLRPILGLNLPRGLGLAATCLLILASAAYGITKGEHWPTIITALKDARDQAANAAGFRIETVQLSGRKGITGEEVLAAAGITERSSLLFLDVEAARAGLKANPWIAEATVRKLYPGRLQITIEEREPYALWQKNGKVSVIAADGTVIIPLSGPRYAALPLVVGTGAETGAREFLSKLDRYPGIRDATRASIRVADRRWNLKLKNGIDVRLPELEAERALEALAMLDHDKKLLTRDIVAIDMRVGNRVTVRLSDEAAQARADALKKAAKKKAGDA